MNNINIPPYTELLYSIVKYDVKHYLKGFDMFRYRPNGRIYVDAINDAIKNAVEMSNRIDMTNEQIEEQIIISMYMFELKHSIYVNKIGINYSMFVGSF